MNKTLFKVLSYIVLSINILAVAFLIVSALVCTSFVQIMGLSQLIVLIVSVAMDMGYIIYVCVQLALNKKRMTR